MNVRAAAPATGKTPDFPFVGVFRVENGKISSIRIFYDQVEVFTQLGLMREQRRANVRRNTHALTIEARTLTCASVGE
jgi:hypothetical protein